MGLQVSYSVCPKMQKESILWTETKGDRSNSKAIVRIQERKYNRG